jgi:uncharacterized membrane protein YGL010W
MKNLTQILSSYHEYHTKKITGYTHMVGVPLIVFALLLVLSWFSVALTHIFTISIMWITIAIAAFYYIKLDRQLGIILTLIFIVLGELAALIGKYTLSKSGFYVFLTIFILGWLIQFVGHYFERRKPAFLDNIMQVFAAPIFVLAEILVLLGKRPDLSWIIQPPEGQFDV